MSFTPRYVSTCSPPPPQFVHIVLNKRELLSGAIAVHVNALAELEAVLSDLTRLRGVIIIDSDRNAERCLAPGLLLLHRRRDEWPTLAQQVLPVLHLVNHTLAAENREHEQELLLQRLRYDLDTMQEDYQRVTTRLQQQVSLMRVQADELRTMNEALEQRVQARTADLTLAYQELESFSYSISHDLRAPIRAVIGFGEMLRETAFVKLDEDEQKLMLRIAATAQRMNELVDSLLSLARTARGALNKTRIDLSALCHDVIHELKTQHSHRQVDFRVQDDMFVLADRQLLTAVLHNVIGNSIKFTAKRDPATITIQLTHHHNHDAVAIADNGAGFDMALAQRLFTPFFRMHRQEEFPGTGVGLATVQRIIQRHGGRVSVDSALDQGTVVSFTLPTQ